MVLEGKMWIKFMISVAMGCTMKNRPGLPLDGNEAAAFIRDVLYIALDGSHQFISVEVIPYPVTTKVPLLISVGNGMSRLFWYYPIQDRDEMCEQLTDLVSELQVEHAAQAIA